MLFYDTKKYNILHRNAGSTQTKYCLSALVKKIKNQNANVSSI